MKKWIAALCAVVIIAGAVIGIIANNGNQRVDALNKDLADRQTEIDSLLRQTEADAETIKDLNVQVEQAKETIDGLTAENGRLSGEIEQLNTNLSSSQQKLQQIITIITGEAENASPYTDVAADSAFFPAVSYVVEKGLMEARAEDLFGLEEPATEEEWALASARLEGFAPAAETAEEPAAETAEEPAAETAEEPAAETAEEPAAETAEEPAAETAEEPAAETAEEPAAETAEEPAAETAEEPAAETAEEPAAETAEEPAALSREALLGAAEALCKAAGLELPAITLPDSEKDFATRGDLALVLMNLDSIEK